MSETQRQSLIRLGRVLAVGVLTTLLLHLPEILDAFTIDPTLKVALVPTIIAVVEGILLALGGATVQSSVLTPEAAVKTQDLERPPIMSM